VLHIEIKALRQEVNRLSSKLTEARAARIEAQAEAERARKSATDAWAYAKLLLAAGRERDRRR
jgi:outer membrane murein-binding lipoprotein Lpp